MYIYTKIVDGQRVLYGTNNAIPSANDKALKYYKPDETEITSLTNFKLYYDVHRDIFASIANIPTNSDIQIIPCIVNADNSLTPIFGQFDQPTISLSSSTISEKIQGGIFATKIIVTYSSGTVTNVITGSDTVTAENPSASGDEVEIAGTGTAGDSFTVTYTVTTTLGFTASASCVVTLTEE